MCRQIATVVEGRTDEPRFSRDGRLIIVAESERDKLALLKLEELDGIEVKAGESKVVTS